METIETNKLIAEFMGWKKDIGYRKGKPIDGFIKPNDGRHFPLYRFRFHESWDWLMPVVEKIESLGFYVRIHGKSTLIFKKDGYNIINRPYGYGKEKSKIDHTYKAVIEFIKWYNK
jgi:hypothetical protein